MKIIAAVLTVFCLSSYVFCADIVTARQLADEASGKDSVSESVDYIKKTIPSMTAASEKRSAYAFLGSVQEQMGLYSDACSSFAAAAAIQASDAKGMPVKSNEQLVVDAVRCALSAGDSATADSYLNSAVRSSKDQGIIAHVKLYEQWSALCRADTVKDTEEPVAMLKAYADLESMKSVAPSVLLTLWHVTGDSVWSDRLKKDYPDTLECALVKGSVQQLPSPFWYFVPRKGSAVPDIENAASSVTSAAVSEESSEEQTVQRAVCLQLGLFREESNAKSLVAQLKEKGFDARITTETRPSGTMYYLVVVDENSSGTMGDELRTAGFECYPLF